MTRIAVPLVLDPAALAGVDARAVVEEIGGTTMGTGWRVRLVRPTGVALAPLHGAVARLLDQLVAEMSHWEADSLLCRFNRAAPGSWIGLPPAFAQVMAAALAIAERSGGAFDPAIGALVDLWGFGPPGPQPAPGAPAVAAARARSGWQRLRWDAGARRLYQPGGVQLDLSGIAKGHAVDAVGDLLRAAGVRHQLVEIGGECRGRGLKPDGEPWWVDLEAPPDAAVAPLRVALHELAVATSGDYIRGNHTTDPRTGRPATTMRSASVLHDSAMWADGWASALMVLDDDAGRALAVREALAVRTIGADEWISPALAAMLAD